MQRKLTIDDQVYDGLHSVVGRRKISRFIEDLARPHVLKPDLEAAYREMAQDTARADDALEWAEAMVGDAADEER